MDPGRGRQGSDLTGPGDGARPPRERRRLPIPLGGALTWHLVSLAVGALVLFYATRNQWFYGDEWDFLADRSVTIGDKGLFVPHNEHWSTGPILIYGLLFRAFGLTSYAPYLAVLIAAHLAVVHLMWRVMVRGSIRPWLATVVCAAFIPYGAGADNLLWAFQIGFVGSVAAGLAAIILSDHKKPFGGRDYLTWGVSVLGLTFSGITIPLVAAASLVAWSRRGFRAFLITMSVPAAAYLVWLFTVGSEGLGEIAPVTSESLRQTPQFVWRGTLAALSLGTSTPLTGTVLLVLTATALVIRRKRKVPLPHAAIAAAGSEVLLLVMVGVGRTPFGLETADATRYLYIGGALLLPLLVVGLSDFLGRRVVGVILVGLLAAPWAAYNGQLLFRRAELQAEREGLIREQIVAAGTLFDEEPVLRTRVDPTYSRDLHLDELRLLLPRFPEDATTSLEGTIRAALALGTSFTRAPELQGTPSLDDVRALDASIVRLTDGCVRFSPADGNPRALIPVGDPASFELTPAAPLEGELLLSAEGLRPDYRIRFELRGGAATYLNQAIDMDLVGKSYLVVRFDQPMSMCPVDGSGTA